MGNTDLEILRWATALDTQVRGGFTRCLSLVHRELAPSSIISYCDLRTGTGSVYMQAGFVLSGITPPGYEWHKGATIIPRHRAQKHLLPKLLGANFDAALSERDNMEANGWWRVSDCGHQRWILSTPETAISRQSQAAC